MEINDASVVATLKAVVAERPDYIYKRPAYITSNEACLYVHPSEDGSSAQPGCIVGHVLNRLGIGLPAMAQHEGADAGTLVGALGLTNLSPDTLGLLDDVQGFQDSGETWAEALSSAEECFDERAAELAEDDE